MSRAGENWADRSFNIWRKGYHSPDMLDCPSGIHAARPDRQTLIAGRSVMVMLHSFCRDDKGVGAGRVGVRPKRVEEKDGRVGIAKVVIVPG